MKIGNCLTALVTPFKDGGIDEDAFQSHVEWQIEQGIHGLVPVGTTGESATLTDEEHRRVITLCVEAAAGRVPIVAGAGSNETVVSVEYARHAKELGADAALVVTPYYNKPNQEGLFRHYEAINEVGIPIVVYNIPGRSIVDIETETLARISRLSNVIGCKDATGEVGRVQLYLDHCEPDFVQLSGDDETILGYMAHGGHGVISVGANIAPAKYAKLCEALTAKDLDTARKLNHELQGLHKSLFYDPNPAPTKWALSEMCRMEPTVRLPMVEPSDSVKTAVRAAMERAGAI